MKIFDYKFDSSKCEVCGGKCCIGESGLIWINEDEIRDLSNFLNFSIDEFKEKFLIKIRNRFSIKEKPFENGFACIFFDEKKRNCSIYEFRPNQCRTFPFWEYFIKNYSELERECIAVSKF